MPLLPNLGNLLGGGENWLFDFQFNSDYAAPLNNPFTDGIGILYPVQNDGQLSTSGGKLVFPAQATPVDGDQGFYIEKPGGGAFDRKSGRIALFKANFSASPTPSFPNVGLNRVASILANTFDVQVYVSAGLFGYAFNNAVSPGGILAFTAGVDYYILLWELTQGARALIKGGVYTDWSLLFDSTQGNNATLYPVFDNYQTAGTMDFVRGKDLSPDYQTDYANIPGLVRVTSSNQSLGSELLTNGGFTTWSGDNPLNWSISGESGVDPMVTEVSGKARLYSSATGGYPRLAQSVMNGGSIYQMSIEVVTVASGNGNIISGSGSSIIYGLSTTGVKRMLVRQDGAAFRIHGGGLPTDITVDNASTKQVTVNTPITTPVATHVRLLFPLATSPVAGDKMALIVRLNAVGEEFYNCFTVEAFREDASALWTLNYCRYLAGSRVVLANSQGNAERDGLYVILEGNNHRVFTRRNSTAQWVQLGVTMVDPNFNNATLANEVHTEAWSNITELIALPFNTGWVTPLAGL